MNTQDELDDLPEMTEEHWRDLRPAEIHVDMSKEKDLHLGAPVVKGWWIKEFGPKPKGPEIYALDALSIVLGCALLYFVFKSWLFVFS